MPLDVKTRRDGVIISGDDANQRELGSRPGMGLRQPKEWGWEQEFKDIHIPIFSLRWGRSSEILRNTLHLMCC